jgi:hypothetical protein
VTAVTSAPSMIPTNGMISDECTDSLRSTAMNKIVPSKAKPATTTIFVIGSAAGRTINVKKTPSPAH